MEPKFVVYMEQLNLFCHGGRWSLYSLGGGHFDPHFLTAPGTYWAKIFSILIIILFKERRNDYLEEKKLGQYLEK